MFGSSYRLFKILGFEVKLDLSWILIAALVVWSLSGSYFPTVLPNEAQGTYLAMGIVAMILFFACLLAHELSHAWVARRYGIGISGITLFVFGGVAELAEEPKTPGVEFWMAAAGPAMSLALALAFWLLASIAAQMTALRIPAALFSYLALINLVLAVFNLIPAFPLDGGRMYRAWLWNRSGNLLSATHRASRVGSTFGYVLMALGALSMLSGQGIGALWQILIGLFIVGAAKGAYQHVLLDISLRNKTAEQLMTAGPHVVAPETSLTELVNETMLPFHANFIPVVENGIALGYVDAKLLGAVDRENWSRTVVADVLQPIGESNSVTPDKPVGELLRQMTSSGARKILVVEGQQLRGVITLTDLMAYLTLLQDLNGTSQGRSASR